jgi:hypothetical protein
LFHADDDNTIRSYRLADLLHNVAMIRADRFVDGRVDSFWA